MSAKQYPPTKPVCQLDADSLYLHQTVADLDPLAADGNYLLPAGCIDTAPPEARAGFAACWLPEKAAWQYLPDHRGKTAYQTSDGAAVVIEQVGELPDGLTFAPRENKHQTWDAKAKSWVLPPAAAARQFAERKTALLSQAATAAQAFIDAAAELDKVPEFEVATWPIQAVEAQAWAADNTAATPVLDRIAAARGMEPDKLKAAALRKALAYSALSAHVAGQRQALQSEIEAAQTVAALDKIKIEFTAPEAG